MTEKLIAKYGQYVKMDGKKKIFKVPCQGCGKDILSGDKGIGYSITKRGTANFWHEKCQAKVWDSKIK